MKFEILTIKEKFYYIVWTICKILTKPFYIIGNWAVDRLNKSYYNVGKK